MRTSDQRAQVLLIAFACLAFVACKSENREPVAAPSTAPLDLTPGERICFADGRMSVAPSRAARLVEDRRARENAACGRSLHYLLNDYFIDIEVGRDIERSPAQFLARFSESGVPSSELPAAFGIRPRALRAHDTRLLTVNVEHELSESDRARGLLMHDKYVVFEHNGLATHVEVAITHRGATGRPQERAPTSALVDEARRYLRPWLEAFFRSLALVRPFTRASSLSLGDEYELSVAHEYDGRIIHGQHGNTLELRPSYEFGAPLPCASLILTPQSADTAPVSAQAIGCTTSQVLGNRWTLCPQRDAARPRCATYEGPVVIGDDAFIARVSGSDAERAGLLGMMRSASMRVRR